MKKRRIALIAVLALGLAALVALERRNAVTDITPRPLFHLIADTERELERLPLELTRVSTDEENQIGKELARQYGLYYRKPETPDAKRMAAYVESVGARVAAKVKRKGIQYHFHFMDESSFVNAFAMPGGQVVFGRGLLELLESEDELASILGHEIAHVDERHAIERLQYELKSRRLGLGGIYRLGRPAVLLFEAGYNKEQEAEADREGLALAVAAGYSPAGAIDVMRRFEQLHGGGTRQAASPLDELLRVPVQSLQEYFRSHPPPRDRIAVMEKEIAERHWDMTQPQRPLGVRAIVLTDRADEFARREVYGPAIIRYRQALEVDPKYSRAWQGLAVALQRYGELGAAADAAAEALKLTPESAPTWDLLVNILVADDPSRAVERFQTLTSGVPWSGAKVLALDKMARQLWKLGEFSATVRAATETLQHNPELYLTWDLLARALAANQPSSAGREYARAMQGLKPVTSVWRITEANLVGLEYGSGQRQGLDRYRRLLQTNPPGSVNAALRRRMAWWMYHAGKPDEAAKELEAARQTNAGDATSLRLLALAYSDLNRQADALQFLQMSRSAGSADSFEEIEPAAIRALIEWRSDQRAEARASFREAVKNDAEWMVSGWVRANLSTSASSDFGVLQAMEFDRRGEFERALALYDDYLNNNPKSFGAWEGLALASWRSGDAAGAARAAEEALGLNPQTMPLWGLFARALALVNPQTAEERLQRSMETLRPGREIERLVRLDLAGIALLNGRPDAARRYAEVLSGNPGAEQEAALRARMAGWMYRGGKAKEARAELEAAIHLSEREVEALRLRPWVASDLGRQAEAEKWLTPQIAGDYWQRMLGPEVRQAEDAALRALIQQRSGKTKEAQEAFAQAAKLDPAWMQSGWPRNEYSGAAATVFAELRTAEIARRKNEAETRAAQRRALASMPGR